METALRISYQGGTPSEALNSLITDHVEMLEKLHGRLTSCQVTVRVPDRHHRTSNLFSVNIHIALPGHIDVNIDHMSHDDERFADPTFAVNDAFRRAKRQIKERARKQRGDVKNLHERVDRTLDRPEP